MDKKLTSFQAANIMPWKIFQDVGLMQSLSKEQKILPRHLQIGPTSVCNLNCPFCSCKNRAKTVLSIEELKEIVDISAKLGTVGYTVTGDGEPLLHPQINEFFKYSIDKGIKIGLVSNGVALNRLSSSVAPLLTWIRISFADYREIDSNFIKQLKYLQDTAPKVDKAFSYVVSPQYDIKKIAWIIAHANKNNYTHVRFVADLYQVELVPMEKIQSELKEMGVDTDRCIFQGRTEWTKGVPKCWISLLKPMIASDGYIYPCCGVQYALLDEDKQRMFPPEMRMGHYKELPEIIEKQKCFGGAVCQKCYYDNYNATLSNLLVDYQHREFI